MTRREFILTIFSIYYTYYVPKLIEPRILPTESVSNPRLKRVNLEAISYHFRVASTVAVSKREAITT